MKDLQRILELEKNRQATSISLIASENYASRAVLEATGSVFTNKYSEGYPGKRYYAGNEFTDELELLTIQLAQEVFSTDYHVNVQPHSGSDANLAVYGALLKPGDTVLALSLSHGGHLTHGHTVSYTGQVYNFVHYSVQEDTELINYDEVQALARQHKPKLIVCGASAYPMHIDFARFAKIAQANQAWLLVDMAHIAGLIAGKAHPSPFGYADVVTTTTQKTLRGPRGGMIFCRKEFAKAIDKAVFPGLQGGPHMHTIAAKAAALYEALQPQFREYAKQVVINAQALAYAMQQRGFRLVGNGTDTHLFLMDLRGTGMHGKEAQSALEKVGITCNMNALPYDPNPPTSPSGLRIGTAAVTTRGMKERDMEILADCITAVLTTEDHSSVTQTIAQIARKFRIPGY
jgi:glycine hydroxymethyltransferase